MAGMLLGVATQVNAYDFMSETRYANTESVQFIMLNNKQMSETSAERNGQGYNPFSTNRYTYLLGDFSDNKMSSESRMKSNSGSGFKPFDAHRYRN